MKKYLLLAPVLLLSLNAKAQFTLSAELRPRYEYRNGYKRMPQGGTIAANLVTQRTRLSADWKGKRISTRITIQDVRIWGDEALKTDVAGLGLYEGWAEFGITDSLSVRVGRQALRYDNARLIDIGNWGQKGTVHDALLVKYRQKGWALDLAAAFNQSKDTLFSTDYNYNLKNYKALALVWLSKSFGKFRLSALGIADGYQQKNTKNTVYLRVTHGLMAHFKTGFFQADLRGFYQSGQYETSDFISAYYGNIDLTFIIAKKISVLVGGEMQSGQDSTDTYRRGVNYFSTLYGSAHSFNGSMDYFTKPEDTRNAGLVDLYINMWGTFGKRFTPRADVHYFRLQNKFPDKIKSGTLDPFLAWEADLSCNVSITKEVAVQAGYSALFGGHTLETLAGGDDAHYAHWAFVMITVKPVFFKWEPKNQ